MYEGGPFAQNTILVACEDGRTGLIVDPGAATARALADANRRGLDIAALLLTHAHVDHVDGVALAARETGAPIHLHPFDRPLYDATPNVAAYYGVPFEVPPPPDEEIHPDRPLSFGGTELEVVFVPGHAPGHVMFVSSAEGAAISGDVVFRGSIGRTDLPMCDHDQLMESIRSRVLTLPPETRLYPGHGPVTTVELEARTNPFLIPLRRP